MKDYVLTIRGDAATGEVIDAAVLRDLLDLVIEGVRRSVRLRVEGRSTVRATPPTWLVEASAFRFRGIESGSSCVHVEAGSLAEQSPDRFAQMDMFILPTDEDRTGLELFAESLNDALDENLDSDVLDRSLVDWFAGFKRLFSVGVSEFEITGAGLHTRKVALSDIETLERMVERIPPSQAVRVAGTLDSVKASNRTFELRLQDDSTIRGVFPGDDFDEYKAQLGELVVVTGDGDFKASGKLRQLHAHMMRSASPDDQALWSHAPTHLSTQLSARELKKPAGKGDRHVVARLRGAWPGEETDDELNAAMEEFFGGG